MAILEPTLPQKNTPVLREHPHRNVVGRRHLEGEERKSNVCFAKLHLLQEALEEWISI